MSSIPEPARTLSPRCRPPSAPSRNASISRPNSGASNSATATKKRPRGEKFLNNLPEDPDQTVIHSPQTPPPAQSPGKAVRTESWSSRHPSRSPDRTVMPPPSSAGAWGGGGTSPDHSTSDQRGEGQEQGGEGRREGRREDAGASGERRREDARTPEEEQDERDTSSPTDDLLAQLPDYDWTGFMTRFEETLKEVGAEKERLSTEYDMWNWMYEIWSSSRDRDDTRRLSREMATIIQWTKLKEADLERAREAHTQSMLTISSVLGIVPKNATPPPTASKKKQR